MTLARRSMLAFGLIFSLLLTGCGGYADGDPREFGYNDKQIKIYEDQLAEAEKQLETLEDTPENQELIHGYMYEKATMLSFLGQYNEELATREAIVERFGETEVDIHNFGRFHEQVGEHEKAVEHYNRLVEMGLGEYRKDIYKAYIKAKEGEKAHEHYQLYLQHGGSIQEQDQWIIDALRKKAS